MAAEDSTAGRLHNLWRSAGAETVHLAPKAPIILPLDSVIGLKEFWAKSKAKHDMPHIPFEPVSLSPEEMAYLAERLRQPDPLLEASLQRLQALSEKGRTERHRGRLSVFGWLAVAVLLSSVASLWLGRLLL